QLSTTPMPPETLERSMAAPSLLAHVAVAKYCDGLVGGHRGTRESGHAVGQRRVRKAGRRWARKRGH
ncbi:MAG: hypothetical protein L0Y66_25075, partial [Myxococcaceae bacterium]|nr:hypothetical protein [Myxococcaceae bacterium]